MFRSITICLSCSNTVSSHSRGRVGGWKVNLLCMTDGNVKGGQSGLNAAAFAPAVGF